MGMISSMKTEEKLPGMMAFYHQDGLAAAWQQAIKFAGKHGRIATMPDIVASRLATKPGDAPWETYYTTLSAEYFGIGKDGRKLIIVAHGIGPMSTLDGILKAYSWQYKDKSRNRRGGRITQKEFLDLEAGKFGEVEIVNFEEYAKMYRYSFTEVLKASWAESDPLLKARFGPRTEEYVKFHAEQARTWHREQASLDPGNKYQIPDVIHKRFIDHRTKLHTICGAENSDPYIIQVQDDPNCSYKYGKIEKGYAFAHLLSTNGLCHVHHEQNESLVLSVHCHAWSDGTKLVGVQSAKEVQTNIQTGPDANELLKAHWPELMQILPTPPPIGFCALMKLDEYCFTQYPKIGACLNTWEPEYLVTKKTKVGDPVLFRTTIGGYHAFFKFDINEVKSIAPPTANAYEFVSETATEYTDGDPTHHTAMVQFYLIDADASKRLIRSEELARDYETMMKLLNK